MKYLFIPIAVVLAVSSFVDGSSLNDPYWALQNDLRGKYDYGANDALDEAKNLLKSLRGYKDFEEPEDNDYLASEDDFYPQADEDEYIDFEDQKETRSNNLRDPEHIAQSTLWGTHYVSGGAGEGKQHLKPNGAEDNKQEVKSDANLPAYCEPPNPCPKGYSEDKNCRNDIQDTAEFNRKYILAQQVSGYCNCDNEHMKHCPKDKNKEAKNKAAEDIAADLQALFSGKQLDVSPFVKDGHKNEKLVAKKTPHFSGGEHNIHKRATAENMDNPYLAGERLQTAGKKRAPNSNFDPWDHYKQLQQEDDFE